MCGKIPYYQTSPTEFLAWLELSTVMMLDGSLRELRCCFISSERVTNIMNLSVGLPGIHHILEVRGDGGADFGPTQPCIQRPFCCVFLKTSCFPPLLADPSWQTLSGGKQWRMTHHYLCSANSITAILGSMLCCSPGTVKYQINNCN